MIRRLPELLLRDFWLKLFSLALAILIWFTIFQAIQQQGSAVSAFNPDLKKRIFYNLEVRLVSARTDIRNFKLIPDRVQVAVQGEGKAVDALQTEDIKVRVDLSDLEGEHPVQRPVEISTPLGLTCVDVEPAEVQVVPPAHSAVGQNPP